jgi:hypothetical protein
LEATQANHSMKIVTRSSEVLYDYVTKRSECVGEEADKLKKDLDSLGHVGYTHYVYSSRS